MDTQPDGGTAARRVVLDKSASEIVAGTFTFGMIKGTIRVIDPVSGKTAASTDGIYQGGVFRLEAGPAGAEFLLARIRS